MRRRRFHLLRLAVAGLATFAALELAACQKSAETATAAAQQVSASTTPTPPPPPPPPPPLTGQDAAMALDALKTAPDHGFSPKRFRTKRIERLLASTDAAERAEGETVLRTAILDYARAQHGLSIPTGALPADWRQRPDYDADTDLNAALRGGQMRVWLDGLPPQTPAYQALQTAYLAAKEEEKTEEKRPKVEVGPLDLGQQDERTEALRKRLAFEDPALADVAPETPIDDDLIAALKAYQARHALLETGMLDDATAARLNTPVMPRSDKLRLNMERLRWTPRPEPPRRIDVNIAAAEMDYIRDGEVVSHMLAVSGKIGDETPLVSSAIDSIVLNPPWYVPPGIARREILPKGAAYMRARHFVWREGRLIQKAGAHAALGLVKFDFPNPYAVYLHDTPSKATFNQAQRAVSHGCVRLQHAVALARTIVSEEPGSSAAQVDRILSSGRTARLKLSQPIPVRLMYLTAVPKGDGIDYLPDVYGWDAKLLALMNRYQAPRARVSSRPAGGPGPAAPAPGASPIG